MSEENNLTREADELPPAPQKTKEQWLDEGHHLAFYAPTRKEEGLAAYEQAIRLDPTYGLAWRMKGLTLHALNREEEAIAAFDQAIALDATERGRTTRRSPMRRLLGLRPVPAQG